MKKSTRTASALLAAGIALALGSAAAAELKVQADGIAIKPRTQAAAFDLRISRPDGEVIQHTALANEGLVVSRKLLGKGIPDGIYSYEVVPVMGVAVRDADATETTKAGPQGLIESGSFSVVDGRFHFDSDLLEPRAAAASKNDSDHGTRDQVIPDDLIVQGSGCFGFDCVNNENFGFDTIKLKENNLRIKFEDTSTGTFPSTDWQLTANDSASGGQNKFSIEDITSARVPFTIEGGSTTNSLYVDSTGRIGFRTATPVLDLHINTSNTPGIRLEQNSSGGFTAQTWDIAGNEANFFVRDVTSGSRLPFRIRPGAPTSSIDIAADGDVGIGTGSPAGSGFETRIVEIKSTKPALVLDGGTGASDFAEVLFQEDNANRWSFGTTAGDDRFYFFNYNRNAYDLTISNANGNIGLGGVLAPANPIQHSNGAVLTAGGVWQNASTREVKESIEALSFEVARRALVELAPVTFRYITDPADLNVGFIAEEVPDLVATESRKTLSAMDIVAVLTRVVQEQEAQIDRLNERLQRLESPQD